MQAAHKDQEAGQRRGDEVTDWAKGTQRRAPAAEYSKDQSMIAHTRNSNMEQQAAEEDSCMSVWFGSTRPHPPLPFQVHVNASTPPNAREEAVEACKAPRAAALDGVREAYGHGQQRFHLRSGGR